MASGGYRPPSNPAPVSGPGALSRRTDSGQARATLPDAAYGENKSFQEIQAGAPMAQAPTPQAGGLSALTANEPAVGFGDPSVDPNTPVTAGAAAGAGPGMEALGLKGQIDEQTEALAKHLPLLMVLANDPTASPAARNFVRQLQSKVSGG